MTLEPRPDVDELAAALRADASDLDAFAESLAVKLEAILPNRTKVVRRRAGLMGPKRVAQIVLNLDDSHLQLDVSGGRWQMRRAKVSGGIALKHDQLEMDEWLANVSAALANEAARSERARQALGELLL